MKDSQFAADLILEIDSNDFMSAMLEYMIEGKLPSHMLETYMKEMQ
jgi:hypothetical protein